MGRSLACFVCALVLVWCVCASYGSKVGPDRAVAEREARQIVQMTADRDIEGLIEMLGRGTFRSKVKVARFLKETGDRRALAELGRANEEFGGWDVRTPCDDRSGVFAIAIWKIRSKGVPRAERIETLLELLEGRSAIVPEPKVEDEKMTNMGRYRRVRGANFALGECAEEELEEFEDAAVTARLRKMENRGVAPYAVWREVRDMGVDEGIARCVEIAHEEGRAQQYGAIHCLRRFDHPDAVVALDLLASEGFSEAIRVMGDMSNDGRAFCRICDHALKNAYYVVRLAAVSEVRYIKNESFRGKSLVTLARAFYDSNEQVRRRAAQCVENYVYPVTEKELAPIKNSLLLGLEHPDEEVRSCITNSLERMGWLGLKKPSGSVPAIRTGPEGNADAGAYGVRRERMLEVLEEKAKRALERMDSRRSREVFVKMLMLDWGNAVYRERVDAWNARRGKARLSEREVLKTADEFAREKRAKYEEFDLANYPDRGANFYLDSKRWFVNYTREPNRWLGDHFTVQIDDATGEMRYIGGH